MILSEMAQKQNITFENHVIPGVFIKTLNHYWAKNADTKYPYAITFKLSEESSFKHIILA